MNFLQRSRGAAGRELPDQWYTRPRRSLAAAQKERGLGLDREMVSEDVAIKIRLYVVDDMLTQFIVECPLTLGECALAEPSQKPADEKQRLS